MYFGLLPKSDLRTWRPADRSPDLFHPMSAATDANGNGQGKKRALEDEPKPMYHRDPSECAATPDADPAHGLGRSQLTGRSGEGAREWFIAVAAAPVSRCGAASPPAVSARHKSREEGRPPAARRSPCTPATVRPHHPPLSPASASPSPGIPQRRVPQLHPRPAHPHPVRVRGISAAHAGGRHPRHDNVLWVCALQGPGSVRRRATQGERGAGGDGPRLRRPRASSGLDRSAEEERVDVRLYGQSQAARKEAD
eukprot:scaffold29644_cov89-Isochrysis_galbana.AAC.2